MARKALTAISFPFWVAGFVLLTLGFVLGHALSALLRRSGMAELSAPAAPRWTFARQR